MPPFGPATRITTTTVPGQMEMSLALRPEHLRPVRHITRMHMRMWEVDPTAAEQFVFAINELLTNVCRHTLPDRSGERVAEVLVQQTSDGLTAVIRDRDCRLPTEPQSQASDETGRGWLLIRALVDEASVCPTDHGKDILLFMAC